MSDDVNPENFPKTQDELNAIIRAALAPKLNKITALEAEKASAISERDAFSASVAERDQRIEALTADVGKRDRELLVTKVAHEKKVPARWLTGDSEEDLVAAADEWLKDASSVAGGSAGAPKEPVAPEVDPEPAPAAGVQARGHVPSAGTGGEKPPRPSYDEVKQRAFEAEKAKQQKGSLL